MLKVKGFKLKGPKAPPFCRIGQGLLKYFKKVSFAVSFAIFSMTHGPPQISTLVLVQQHKKVGLVVTMVKHKVLCAAACIRIDQLIPGLRTRTLKNSIILPNSKKYFF